MSRSLTDHVEELLKADIARGVFAPSQPLRMELLKARFDAGLSPIREALSRLLAEGIVELEANRGFRVPALSRADLLDIAITRGAVETAAVRRAIALGDDAWEAQIVGALHHYKRLAARAFEEDAALEAWEKAHDALHRALICACGSPRLLALQARYQEQHLRYRRLIVIPEVSRDAHIAEHENLVATVLARDAAAAAAAVERHMMITADVLDAAGYWDQAQPPPRQG
ncbi:FCD domain-containing protein [Roseomonas sp. GC11]|uniref:FCD domain-containing protein n=1 Tax=Roseomonas sp. GC11 TaxID=2950546 RepID=UPI002108AE9B|nr:FCD domain-containing protein [Roseomonas sp. GC11]MCQ4160549.1 FCD domain-containing protein [Roseomonas sp. GC11]